MSKNSIFVPVFKNGSFALVFGWFCQGILGVKKQNLKQNWIAFVVNQTDWKVSQLLTQTWTVTLVIQHIFLKNIICGAIKLCNDFVMSSNIDHMLYSKWKQQI